MPRKMAYGTHEQSTSSAPSRRRRMRSNMAEPEARIEFLRGTEQSGDNRASSACAFRACASFRSAALRTAPSSAKQRSTLVRVRGSVRLDTLTTCRAVQGLLVSLTPLQLLLPQHLVLLRLGVPNLCAKHSQNCAEQA